MKIVVKHIALIILTVFISKYVISQSYSEQEVRAAFVCNFAKFTEWPKDKFTGENTPITLAIVGDNPFNQSIFELADETAIGSRKMVVKLYDDYRDCADAHMVYIGTLNPQIPNAEMVVFFEKNNLLTISYKPNFCKMGGIINFSSTETKYGFNINTDAAQKSSLILSTKLLKLGKLVK